MSKKILRVLVSDAEKDSENVRSLRTPIEDMIRDSLLVPPTKVIELETNILSKNVQNAYTSIIESLSNLNEGKSEFLLDQVSFTLGVDSKGEVSLVSTVGGSIGSQIGITFTLSRKSSEQDETNKRT